MIKDKRRHGAPLLYICFHICQTKCEITVKDDNSIKKC